MIPSAKNTATKIAKATFFLSATVVLTLTGWFLSWSQIHSPNWKGEVGIVLLLPYAAVNRVFFWFFHSEQLSPSMYHLAFLLGSLGQMLYYYTIFALVRYVAEMVRRHPRETH